MKEDWNNEEYCLAAVKQDEWLLQHVKKQTEEICLIAVKQNSEVVKFVNKKKFPKVWEYYEFATL